VQFIKYNKKEKENLWPQKIWKVNVGGLPLPL
jgi:hypothetical protein